MPKKTASNALSDSPAYQCWLTSILAMCLPPILVLLIEDFSYTSDLSARLIVFVGFFVVLIQHFDLFEKMFFDLDMKIATVVAIGIIVSLVAMWILILALPAFNQFSQKRRIHFHLIQFLYATVQAAAGYYLVLTEKL